MKKRLLSTLLALCMVLVLLPGTVRAADTSGEGQNIYQIKLTGTNDYDSAYAVFNSLNSYRREKGLSELVMDKDLLAVAMQRAAELAIYFSHTRPDGSDYYALFPSKFLSGSKRENIAVSASSVDAVMTMWKNSSGHNANMLAAENNSVGIGAFVDSGGTRYWVQIFASPQGTAEVSQTSGTQTVTANIEALSKTLNISVSPGRSALQAGETITFTATNTNTEWSYSTPGIYLTYAEPQTSNIVAVSIGNSGEAVVTPLGNGETTVKLGVKAGGDSAPITIDVPVTVSGFSSTNIPSTPSTPNTPTQTTPPRKADAVLSPQNLTVDGTSVDCEKYNIGGSNYFKLRDLAAVLNGTASQFEVGFDAATSTVTITTGAAYTPNGTELATGVDNSATAQPSRQTILIDGAERADLTVYNIGGSNFFRLRELGDALGFAVDFDAAANTAIVRSAQD